MQLLSSEKPSSARDRILQTAHDLFYRDGIRATGVDRLIAESKVTKTTFYRHFKSKKNLILAFLDYRHQRFLSQFSTGIEKHGGDIDALAPTVKEWFESEDFRGCAFLNSVGELGGTTPEVLEITQTHKQSIADLIEQILPESPDRPKKAQAIAMAVDGATVQAQYDQEAKRAIELLEVMIQAVANS